MAALTEISGVYVREFQRWDQTAMLQVEMFDGCETADVTVKLDCDPDELQADQEYRFVGTWKNHPKYGRQFHASSFILVMPHTRQGVIQYLRRAGEGLRFGPVRAAALYDEWGQDAVRMAREKPAEVAALLASRRLQFDHAAAVNLSARLGDDAALESCTLDVLDLLTGRGFPRSTVRDVVKEWGARAAIVVRRDPYKLMRFRGCGFKRCDAMWLELGLPPGRLKRQALAAWYAIRQDTDGHTWYPITVAERAIHANVGGAVVDTGKAMRMARLGGRLAELATDGPSGAVTRNGAGTMRWVAERRAAENEREVAEIVAEASRENYASFFESRPAKGFDGYRIFPTGKIESCWSNSGDKRDSWKEISAEEIKGGYLRVRLRSGLRKYQHVQVSHLMLETFVGPRPLDAVCCHRDGSPKNNKLGNLRWDTRSANEEDKKLAGTHQTGSGNPAAKLTETDVLKIRDLYEFGGLSTYELGRRYSVDRSTICDIVKRDTWSHV